MESKKRSRKSGLSLIEIIVAAFLLVLVGLVCWALLQSAIKSSAHGHLEIKTQENARLAMETVNAELKQAVRPPRVSSAIPQYPSGVLYPCTTDADTTWENGVAGTDKQRVLLFEVQGLNASSHASINSYKIVEYRILPDASGTGNDTTGNARIVRRTWNALDSTNTTTYIRGLQYSANFFIDPEASFNDGYDTTPPEKVIMELPNPNDTIAMSIYHPPFGSLGGLYDYKIFRIKIIITQYLNAPDRALSTQEKLDHRKKEIPLETQVSLP